ncbi:hypothetical protein [Fulvivirga lutimaris]|uniref:hypothetical protein n=1 Tax=Fulvivirga lutimaris TaxID=1819566 RepID=UPI0012BC7442|nr:hypothetical protein [Fulvivirga lutimaris]MTI40240.1 hypothetical protein [Fulvivirga lutimaris]
MPIANCYINTKIPEKTDFNKIVLEWSDKIGASPQDITLNVFTDFVQYGNKDAAMVNLYLPSLWPQQDVENIQSSLSGLLEKYLKIEPDQVFIMTSIIQSGHVFSDGKTERW